MELLGIFKIVTLIERLERLIVYEKGNTTSVMLTMTM